MSRADRTGGPSRQKPFVGQGSLIVEWISCQRLLSPVALLRYSAVDLRDADRDRLRLGKTKFLTTGQSSPDGIEARLEELLDQAIEKPTRP